MTTLDIVTITMDDIDGCIRTLESTRPLRKKYAVRQIIIDGSKEENAARLRKQVANQTDIFYQWTKPAGVAAAYNSALEHTTSDRVWFLNASDTMCPDMDIEVFWYLLSHCTSAVLLFRLRDYTGNVRDIPPLPFLWPPVFVWLPMPAAIINTKALMNCGAFDPTFRIAMDGDMWFRLLNNRTIKVDLISVPLVNFDKEGLSGNMAASAIECLRMLKRHRYTIFKRWVQSGMRYFEAKRKFFRRSKIQEN